VPKYEARFMELLRYALHLNTENLKVNWFVFGLNLTLRISRSTGSCLALTVAYVQRLGS
jgi:hypothetical protein